MMNKTPTVYLAGPIMHKSDDGSLWREQLADEFHKRGLDVINPLTAVDADEATERVVEADLELIGDSDVLFVRWETVPMAGTPMEIRYCYEQDIPVVVWHICDRDQVSGWVEYHASELYDNVVGAMDAVEDYTERYD